MISAVMDLEDKSAIILGSPLAEEFVVSFNQTMQVLGLVHLISIVLVARSSC